MKSLLWSIAVLFSSLAATMLAAGNYCYDNYICSENTVNMMNMTSVIFFSMASFILLSIVLYTIMYRNHMLKNRKKNMLFCI